MAASEAGAVMRGRVAGMRSERASKWLYYGGPVGPLESCWSEVESHWKVLTRGVALSTLLTGSLGKLCGVYTVVGTSKSSLGETAPAMGGDYPSLSFHK